MDHSLIELCQGGHEFEHRRDYLGKLRRFFGDGLSRQSGA
jgi:hypothetical protein